MEGFEKEIHDAIVKIAQPIIDKVPQEQIINHTLVGYSSKKHQSLSDFNSHNCRLYFDFSKATFNPSKRLVGGKFMLLHSKNYGSEFVFSEETTGSHIITKKTQIEVRYKIGIEDWKKILNAKPEVIFNLAEEKVNDSRQIIKDFIDEFGGLSEFRLLKSYFLDNKIKNNSLTKKLRKRDFFETELCKKWYPKKEIEYKTLEAARNAMHNAGLYDFDPQLCEHLNLIYSELEKLNSFRREGEAEKEMQDLSVESLQEGQPAINSAQEPSSSLQFLKDNIKSVEDGLKQCKAIESLSFDDRWKLAQDMLNNINFQWDRVGERLR